MMADTEACFEGVEQSEMVRQDPRCKLRAAWGQPFDIEQLLEHAIVHASRHRRQVVRFKAILRGQT